MRTPAASSMFKVSSKKHLEATRVSISSKSKSNPNHMKKFHTDAHSVSEKIQTAPGPKVKRKDTKSRRSSNDNSEDDVVEILSPRRGVPDGEDDDVALLPKSPPLLHNHFDPGGYESDIDVAPGNLDSPSREDGGAVAKIRRPRTPSPSLYNRNTSTGKYKPKEDVRIKKIPATAANDSYLTGIVPETETESSANTQSQPHPFVLSYTSPLKLDAIGSVPATPRRTQEMPGSSPDRSSVSRMKPRTPSSPNLAPNHIPSTAFSKPQNDQMAPRTKPLGPVPVVSPSIFRPHLPSSNELSGSRIDSEIEMPEYQPSPIERFSSPEKDGMEKNGGSSGRGRECDIRRNDMRRRGQQLADRARKLGRVYGKDRVKRPLEEVLKTLKEQKAKSVEQTNFSATNGGGRLWSATESHAQGAREEPESLYDAPYGSTFANGTYQDAESLAQEMEDAYVDLTSQAGLKSTQDQ